jgi:site-specific recombinase XerC
MLFDHLVTGGVIEHNPALSVKAPRQKLGKGKTPVLTAEEAGDLLRSIESAEPTITSPDHTWWHVVGDVGLRPKSPEWAAVCVRTARRLGGKAWYI